MSTAMIMDTEHQSTNHDGDYDVMEAEGHEGELIA
jgi:hypothetical protein